MRLTFIEREKRKLEKEESMMCRNDKGRVDPKWKTQQGFSLLPSDITCLACVACFCTFHVYYLPRSLDRSRLQSLVPSRRTCLLFQLLH